MRPWQPTLIYVNLYSRNQLVPVKKRYKIAYSDKIMKSFLLDGIKPCVFHLPQQMH